MGICVVESNPPGDAAREPDAPYLLVRIASQLCALSLEHVEETMRPLPVRVMPYVPPFVTGLTVLRGEPAPVIDARSFLGERQSPGLVTRFVALRTGRRPVALAVDEVEGVVRIEAARLAQLPLLLTAAAEHVVSAIGLHDTELIMVLRSARLVPDAVWTRIEAGDVS